MRILNTAPPLYPKSIHVSMRRTDLPEEQCARGGQTHYVRSYLRGGGDDGVEDPERMSTWRALAPGSMIFLHVLHVS